MTAPPTVLDKSGYKLVYRDKYVLIADKAPNLLTVPGRLPENKDCLISRVLEDYPNSRVVHRLDMATSGLVLLPQTQTALSNLARQFQQRSVKKTYAALVDGLVTDQKGVINAPLACDWPNRPKQHVTEQGKPSKTIFKVIERNTEQNYTRVLLYPITGRSHQLRVHMEYLGHPIIGDPFYGSTESRERANRLLLHAQSIQFEHPEFKVQLAITVSGFVWPK